MLKLRHILIFIYVWSCIWAGHLFGQVFLPDDPIWDDPDRLDMPAPAEFFLSQYYDFYENIFLNPGKANAGPAQNVNTLGEVPNSSWYTNRHYWHPMTFEELRQGPNKSAGPDTSQPWIITRGKGEGITPGFTIKDALGDVYLIKFDPLSNPEMTTGAETISTKFFYALGYNVPENYLVFFSREQLQLSPNAIIKDIFGNKRLLTVEILDELLAKAPRDARGYYRAIASKFLDGKPLGPFRYYGTRPDDGNDIYPHEARRELRGLRVFCAWLNHDDSRSINTLDMLVEEHGKHFVRHHLIDFGSTLGSGSVAMQSYRAGNEYLLEVKPILHSIATLGFWIRPWAKVSYPDYPSIGRIESEFFDPLKWKTEYPNAAFLNCDAEDAFWAARQVMNFSDEEIRAVVSTGQYSNPEAEHYLVETLIKRRNKIGKAYLYFSGGLDKFQIDSSGYLVFEDLLTKYGLEKKGRMRRITWAEVDNESGAFGQKLVRLESDANRIPLPRTKSEYFVAVIETPGMGSVNVYIHRVGSGQLRIVGISRQ